MDKKKPPRRANLVPRSKVKVQAQSTPVKGTAKPAAQPLPKTFKEAYALANPDAQIRDLHLNPKTGVYGSSPYANLLEERAKLEALTSKPLENWTPEDYRWHENHYMNSLSPEERANITNRQAALQSEAVMRDEEYQRAQRKYTKSKIVAQRSADVHSQKYPPSAPAPKTLAEKVAANNERLKKQKAQTSAQNANARMQSWSAQRAQAEREMAINQAAEREAALMAEARKPAQRVTPVPTQSKPPTLREKVKTMQEGAKRREIASRGQNKIQSWSEQRAMAEKEAALAAQKAEEAARVKRIAPVPSQPKPVTLRERVVDLNRNRVVDRGQERLQSWSVQQAEAERIAAMQQAEAQRAYDATYGSGRSGKMSPREATLSSQSRRAAGAAEAGAINVADDAAMAAEGKIASRIGGLTKLRGGASAVLLELLMNPQQISERSSVYDKTGRTWDQVDNDRVASQHYFDAFMDDSQYNAGVADQTAVHAPLYKAPEIQSPVQRYDYTMRVPPAQNYGGSIAQQLGATNPDDAYLDEMRRKKLAQDMAVSAPRQSSYTPGRWAPAPLFREN